MEGMAQSLAEAGLSRPGAAVRRARRRQISDGTIQQLFIMPTLLLLIAMNIFPLFYSLYLSFTDFSVIANKSPVWVGLANFQNILNDKASWLFFATTGRYALMAVSMELLVGFGLAMLVRARFRGSGLITTLILVPMMLCPVVVAYFWKLIFNPTMGIFNYLIGYWNVATAPDWLRQPALTMWALVIVDVWMWSPFVMLLVLSGLKAIPEYLYEAAAIDRASTWFQFWRITLPQVAPLLLIAVLFRTIEAFKQFDLVQGLTGGGPGEATELLAVHLWRLAFQQFKTGQASALAYIVLIIIIAVSNLYVRNLSRIRGE
jgi:multiple sugar transport system permease protein